MIKKIFFVYRYNKHLECAFKNGVRKGFSVGLGMGAFQTVIYSNYGLALW